MIFAYDIFDFVRCIGVHFLVAAEMTAECLQSASADPEQVNRKVHK